MSQEPESALISLCQILDRLSIGYMISGGISAIYYGDPRLTYDADLVIELPKKEVMGLVKAVKKEFFVDEEEINKALKKKRMFQILQKGTAFKIDFYPLKDDPFNQKAFSRRRKKKILGKNMFIITAEDLIITKLNLYKTAHYSEKQLQDVKGIYKLQKEKLDFKYLKKWLAHFSTWKIFEEIKKGRNFK